MTIAQWCEVGSIFFRLVAAAALMAVAINLMRQLRKR